MAVADLMKTYVVTLEGANLGVKFTDLAINLHVRPTPAAHVAPRRTKAEPVVGSWKRTSKRSRRWWLGAEKSEAMHPTRRKRGVDSRQK